MSVAPVRTEAPHETEERSGLRKRRRRRRVDPAVTISLFAVLILVVTLLHVGQRAKVAALTYDMHQALARLDQLERAQRQLIVSVEQARSLGRIESEARRRLGMVRPDDERLFVAHVSKHEQPDVHPGPVQASEVDRSRWLSAFSRWYDRVSDQVRAALPRPSRTRSGP